MDVPGIVLPGTPRADIVPCTHVSQLTMWGTCFWCCREDLRTEPVLQPVWDFSMWTRSPQRVGVDNRLHPNSAGARSESSLYEVGLVTAAAACCDPGFMTTNIRGDRMCWMFHMSLVEEVHTSEQQRATSQIVLGSLVGLWTPSATSWTHEGTFQTHCRTLMNH